MLKIGNRRAGFTLTEVMVTTAVLSLGAVFLYSAFFVSLDLYNYYVNWLDVMPLADEKIWEAQDNLMRFGDMNDMQVEGVFKTKKRNFIWKISYDLINREKNVYELYKINLVVSWKEGMKKARLLRDAYAMYYEKE